MSINTDKNMDEERCPPPIVEKIEHLFLNYKSLGYRGILGIGNNATKEEIKKAYHHIAKEYHPDRFLLICSELPELKEKLNIIFAYINEAYKELSKQNLAYYGEKSRPNPEKRDDNPAHLAKERFSEGKRAMNLGDYKNALLLLGQAAYLDESVADYHFFYGMALVQNKKIKEAESSIRKALQLSPSNSDYAAELGYIYLNLGFKMRAKNAFEEALKFNPNNLYAAEGLKKSR